MADVHKQTDTTGLALNKDTIETLSSASASTDMSSSMGISCPSSNCFPDGRPFSAPRSKLFEIRQTPSAGRAVFATCDIPCNTTIRHSEDLTLSVILREYRREVCGYCFDYKNGRDLHVQDRTVGFAFCSPECRIMWQKNNAWDGLAAWTAVEKLIKNRSKEDSAMVDANLPRPDQSSIQSAWETAEMQASLIRHARLDPTTATKQHRKAMLKALQARISPDTISFCLSGILWHQTYPEDWRKLLALADDDTPYHSIDDLEAFTRTYLHLIAVLPVQLLPHVDSKLLFAFSSRDSHNSFGIRSLEDDGSEFFGYGCWPTASYFNHSCAPNVAKRRVGRTWEFTADTDISMGEELNITYLSGEERMSSREIRMRTLKKNWGFDCGCVRCSTETS